MLGASDFRKVSWDAEQYFTPLYTSSLYLSSGFLVPFDREMDKADVSRVFHQTWLYIHNLKLAWTLCSDYRHEIAHFMCCVLNAGATPFRTCFQCSSVGPVKMLEPFKSCKEMSAVSANVGMSGTTLRNRICKTPLSLVEMTDTEETHSPGTAVLRKKVGKGIRLGVQFLLTGGFSVCKASHRIQWSYLSFAYCSGQDPSWSRKLELNGLWVVLLQSVTHRVQEWVKKATFIEMRAEEHMHGECGVSHKYHLQQEAMNVSNFHDLWITRSRLFP